MWNKRKIRAFTLIEVIIVITIIAILATIGILLLISNINKGNDAKRKADLQRITVAFEEYYTDHNCYPPSSILKTCGGNGLAPYLNNIPCDPVYNSPYCYVTDTDKPTCFQKFRLLATLKYLYDPVIKILGCDSKSYCGWETECNATSKVYGYNFGLGSSNTAIGNPNPTIIIPIPSGLPSPGPGGVYACSPQGVCNGYGPPEIDNCPITFSDYRVCQIYCGYPQFRCPK
jgi:general secretion pathway protein G